MWAKDVLMVLVEHGCLYATVDQPPAATVERARQVAGDNGAWLARWALKGQTTGHEWCYCSQCGEVRLMRPTGLKETDAKKYTDDPPAAHAYCKLTFRCTGHMVRIAKRPDMRAALRRLFDAAKA